MIEFRWRIDGKGSKRSCFPGLLDDLSGIFLCWQVLLEGLAEGSGD
ncbi:MAG: hypothetical protein ACK4TA_20045 [Saprospiraceae bacterium]